MHEAAIAAPLLSLALEEARKRETETGPLRITGITVMAGLLTCVEPVTLRGCFEIMAEGTDADGAELVLTRLPMRGRCAACGRDVETRTRRFACPLCASAEVDWQGGNELYIDHIQVCKKDIS